MRRRILGNRRSGNVVLQTPTDGLLASYEMNGNANDSWGSFHGTDSNVTYTTDENLGNIASFNGSTSQIIIPNNIYVNPGVFSISAWFKVVSESHSCRVLTLNGNTGGPYVSFRVNEGINNTIGVVINSSVGIALQPDLAFLGLSTANWLNVVIRVNNAGTSDVWANNQKRGTAVDTITKTFAYNTISSDSRNVIGTARNFTLDLNGFSTKVNFYNKYLTTDEISTLYNGGLGTAL